MPALFLCPFVENPKGNAKNQYKDTARSAADQPFLPMFFIEMPSSTTKIVRSPVFLLGYHYFLLLPTGIYNKIPPVFSPHLPKHADTKKSPSDRMGILLYARISQLR